MFKKRNTRQYREALVSFWALKSLKSKGIFLLWDNRTQYKAIKTKTSSLTESKWRSIDQILIIVFWALKSLKWGIYLLLRTQQQQPTWVNPDDEVEPRNAHHGEDRGEYKEFNGDRSPEGWEEDSTDSSCHCSYPGHEAGDRRCYQ